MRKIEITLNSELPVLQSTLYTAIGYLSMWSITSENKNLVRIYSDGAGVDLIAHYYFLDSEGKAAHTYTIGAIYNKETQKYSFHS